MIVVFRGPTISAAETRAELDAAGLTADVRGPAAQGDVLRAVRDGATTVLLLDGVYERVAAVWHKELLHALSCGVRVIGASSMGALRAAECAPYGMQGVGEVFRQVVSGELVADGDVAVAHRDAEDDWAPTSVAMVDVRATIAAALLRGDLDDAAADRLLRRAGQCYFPSRTWAAIGAPWLREVAVSVKRDDARCALRALPAVLAAPAPEPDWVLAESDAWRRALAEPTDADPVLLDLVRLEGRWTEALRAGLLRAVAADLCGPLTDDVALAELADVVPDPAAWADAAGLDEAGLLRFARRQAAVTRLWASYADRASGEVADHLRVDGSWGRLAAAAVVRRDLPDDPVDDEVLDAWWSSTTSVSPDPELLGFDDEAHLRQAMRREHVLARLQRPRGSGG